MKRFLRQQRQQLQVYQSEVEVALLQQRIRMEEALSAPPSVTMRHQMASDDTLSNISDTGDRVSHDNGRGVALAHKVEVRWKRLFTCAISCPFQYFSYLSLFSFFSFNLLICG